MGGLFVSGGFVVLNIKGQREHKGFQLKIDADVNSDIVVLTGKNGSGKTRLLESIQNRSSEVRIDGELIDSQEISIVPHSSLNPNLSNGYDITQRQARITATLRFYEQIKHEFDLPYDQNRANMYARNSMGRDNGLDYLSLFRLISSIAKTLNKPASELTDNDIILHFEEPMNNILGIQNISSIVNQYIQRKEQNEINEWKNTIKKQDVDYFTDEEFINVFGNKPWLTINEILNDTFEGKFQFNIPDEASKSYAYQAQLIQSHTGNSVGVDALSSGEKTLLWLALTLFNSQYYDANIIKVPRVLLIDEPDAFLHPKMVAKMYKVLDSFHRNFGSKVVITTHSPTTVALAPDNSVYIIEQGVLTLVEKDVAISELLDGITQISLSPDNRRQVFVESQYDANVYQLIYSKLVHRSTEIDPKISLNFISSGPKMAAKQIEDKVKQILRIDDLDRIQDFVQAVNGVGSCSHVIGQVDALIENGNNSVRGIIDWDKKNFSNNKIAVLGENYAYSIENIALDPICIMLLLHMHEPDKFTVFDICGKDTSWFLWLEDIELLQASLDKFILKVLGRDNNKDVTTSYISGINFLTDTEYLNKQGHSLEKIVKQNYPQLNAFATSKKDGELKWKIVQKSMITYTDGKLIPKAFESVISSVQK
ncbi:recombination protein F [Photobacterium malacitanum]|uniref:Recombination protein F n=1 Tax=Photobacterium malacitanum TaxID=2204294 RepID=A0A1Y6MIR4_9GAMM|nr:ATP-binding protein [Photobacterium malacitanum]SMY35789.1 recombination protein F [Photobacterium malacitanum]